MEIAKVFSVTAAGKEHEQGHLDIIMALLTLLVAANSSLLDLLVTPKCNLMSKKCAWNSCNIIQEIHMHSRES